MSFAPSQRILIADDDPGVRTAVCATLEADGYEVVTACDGRSAIEALLTRPFDLAILDLSMPELGGLELLKELEFLHGPAPLPALLMLTAYGSVHAAVESARRGAIDLLHKPISPDSLLAAVRRAILSPDRLLVDHADYYFG